MSFFSGGMEEADLTLLDTFGDLHEVQGQEILCVLDEDEFSERARRYLSQSMDGVYLCGVVLYCKFADIGFRPEIDDLLTVDDVEYQVLACEEGEKLLILTLQENRS